MTPSQTRALATLWPRFGADGARRIDPALLFGRAAPLIVEIGFGNGDALLAAAAAHPENNYLGIEVHRPGIGRLLRELDVRGQPNVRVIDGDAKEVLREALADASLAGVRIFFPDPWPKKRHHKRRLIEPGFVSLLAAKLKPGAIVHLATDWADYAQQMQRVLDAEPTLEPAAGVDADARAETRFERRGRTRGHNVWDLVYRRSGEGVNRS